MKKIILIFIINLFFLNLGNAEFLVVVKSEIDENVFIKRKNNLENEAINVAIEGCQVIYRYREDIKDDEKKALIDSCYVFKIIEQ
jgi:hypothetical protein